MTQPSASTVLAAVADDMRRVDALIGERLDSDVPLVRQVAEYIVAGGGKQYRVKSGEQVRVESLAADVGAAVSFDQVLAVGEGDAVRVGAPLVAGAQVKATVVAHGRGEKLKIYKLRRRKHYQKTQGHRQNYTEVRIDDIVGGA